MDNKLLPKILVAIKIGILLPLFPAIALAQDFIEPDPALLQTAQSGDKGSQYIVGALFDNAQNYPEAVRWYELAANQGDLSAQKRVAMIYLKGEKNLPADPVKAAYWLLIASKQHDKDSQRELAMLYAKGLGVPRDDISAAKWYFESAKQNDGDHCCSL